MNIYEKNLQALSRIDTELFNNLQEIETNKLFDVYLAENDVVENVNIVDLRSLDALYVDSPTESIKKMLIEFEQYEFYQFLYFFGIGNGSFYKKLLFNEHLRRVMVFEPEIELLYIVFNLIDFSEEMLSGRLIIKWTQTVRDSYLLQIFQNDSRLFLKVYDFHVYLPFYERYENEIKRINQGLINGLKHALTALGNDVEDMLIGIKQSLKNIPLMLQSPKLSELFKKAANTKTAILVATGPSLTKQLPLLKSVQEHVTILCLDASFRILVNNGIKPDIVFSLERVPAVKHLFEDISKEFFNEVIFEFPTVVSDDVLEIFPGKVSFYMRRDSYNQFFEFDEWGYLAGGTSVANIVYNFATKSMFDELVLLGQDLSFSEDGLSHSDGHVFGTNEVKTVLSTNKIKAYGGVGFVETTPTWLSFLNSFRMQIQESSLKTINATEGGARIEGAIEMSFQDVCDKVLNRNIHKKPIILDSISNDEYKKSLKQFHKKECEMIQIGENVKSKAQKILDELKDFFVRINQYSQEEIEEKVSTYYLDKIVVKIDTFTTKIYNTKPFVNTYVPILSPSISTYDYNSVLVIVMKEDTEYAKKKKKIAWINFKYKWFELLIENIEKVLLVYKSEENI